VFVLWLKGVPEEQLQLHHTALPHCQHAAIFRVHFFALAGAPEEQLQLLLQRMEDVLVYLQHQAAKIFAPVSEYVPFSSFAAAPAGVAAMQGGGWGHPGKQQQVLR
jgi:hypothetical protein